MASVNIFEIRSLDGEITLAESVVESNFDGKILDKELSLKAYRRISKWTLKAIRNTKNGPILTVQCRVGRMTLEAAATNKGGRPKTVKKLTETESVTAMLRVQIESGVYGFGDQLPSVSKMSREFGVNTRIIYLAREALEKAGYIEIVRGYGGAMTVCWRGDLNDN